MSGTLSVYCYELKGQREISTKHLPTHLQCIGEIISLEMFVTLEVTRVYGY
jgi:hypothetical protein